MPICIPEWDFLRQEIANLHAMPSNRGYFVDGHEWNRYHLHSAHIGFPLPIAKAKSHNMNFHDSHEQTVK